MKISRSFTVPAGNYDVFLIAKEPTPEKAPKNAAAEDVGATDRQRPRFLDAELATSSVIVAQRSIRCPRAGAAAAGGPSLARHDGDRPDLRDQVHEEGRASTFMLITTQLDSANKPDVSVEYNFYRSSPVSRRSSSTRPTRRT
jgi:hypothetical protein